MKKTLLILAAALMGWGTLVAQTPIPYTNGFENPSELLGWTLLDQDGDGHNWQIGYGPSIVVHSGNGCLYSESFDLNSYDALTPNNWLISPEFTIPAGGATLTYWVAPQSEDYNEEHYKVMLSTTAGTSPSDFTENLFEETINYATWTQHSVSFETAGTVRIAFVHYQCCDEYALLIDDISVTPNDSSLLQRYTITAESADPEMGTVSGGGDYAYGTTCTLTATAAEGYHFVEWQDGNRQNPRSFTVTEDATYTATFAETMRYTITIQAALVDPEGNIRSYLNEDEFTSTGAGTYDENSVINISAEALGYYFWIWDDDILDNPREIDVTGDETYVAYFTSEPMGIDDVEGEVLRVEYYDLMGRQLKAEPARGVYMVRTVTSRGTSVRKMVRL